MDSDTLEGTVITVTSLMALVTVVMCFTASAQLTVYSAAAGLAASLISYVFFGKHTRELLRIFLAVQIIIIFVYVPKING